MNNNLLKNLFASFNKKTGGGNSAIGIDIGSSAIKVVEIKKKRRQSCIGDLWSNSSRSVQRP